MDEAKLLAALEAARVALTQSARPSGRAVAAEQRAVAADAARTSAEARLRTLEQEVGAARGEAAAAQRRSQMLALLLERTTRELRAVAVGPLVALGEDDFLETRAALERLAAVAGDAASDGGARVVSVAE